MFGIFYSIFAAGSCAKGYVENATYKDESFKRAIKENKDTFYDKEGKMYYIRKRPWKNGETLLEQIRAIDTVKEDRNGVLHKVIMDLKTKEILRDYTQEKINTFYNNIIKAIEECNKKENQKYYFIEPPFELIRDIGDAKFKKIYKPMCGLFEKDNGSIGRRYVIEHYYNKLKKEDHYFKYYYDESNCVDTSSKIEITKDEYILLGGLQSGYSSYYFFDMV